MENDEELTQSSQKLFNEFCDHNNVDRVRLMTIFVRRIEEFERKGKRISMNEYIHDSLDGVHALKVI